jgi:hypothetical protein
MSTGKAQQDFPASRTGNLARCLTAYRTYIGWGHTETSLFMRKLAIGN